MRSLAAVLAMLALALPAAAEVSAAREAELQHMVAQDCGSCHGLTRKGGLGLPLTPAALADRPADDLVEIILDGIPGTAMPPWRPLLSDADAIWIANYLKTQE